MDFMEPADIEHLIIKILLQRDVCVKRGRDFQGYELRIPAQHLTLKYWHRTDFSYTAALYRSEQVFGARRSPRDCTVIAFEAEKWQHLLPPLLKDYEQLQLPLIAVDGAKS